MRQHPRNKHRHLRTRHQTLRREPVIRRPTGHTHLEHPPNRRVLTTGHLTDISEHIIIRRNIPQLIHLTPKSTQPDSRLTQKRVQHKSHLRTRHIPERRKHRTRIPRHDLQLSHLINRPHRRLGQPRRVREPPSSLRRQRHPRRTSRPRQKQSHLPTQHRRTRIIRRRRPPRRHPIMRQAVHRILSKRPLNIGQTPRLQSRPHTRRILRLVVSRAVNRPRRPDRTNSQQTADQTQYGQNSQPRLPAHPVSSHLKAPPSHFCTTDYRVDRGYKSPDSNTILTHGSLMANLFPAMGKTPGQRSIHGKRRSA